jgi:hypothetical protein
MHAEFWWRNLKVEDHLDHIVVDKVIFKLMLTRMERAVDWINLAQDRGKLRAAVNAAMNLWFSQNGGNLSEAEELKKECMPWCELVGWLVCYLLSRVKHY